MLRKFLHRMRRFLTGEVLAELAALRVEMHANSQQIEAALLTLALAGEEAAGSEPPQHPPAAD